MVEAKKTASTLARSKPRRQLAAAATPIVTLSSSAQATARSGPASSRFAGRPASVAKAIRVGGT